MLPVRASGCPRQVGARAAARGRSRALARPAVGGGQDLIQPLRRQRQAASRPLQHHEYPVRSRPSWPLVMQVRAERIEEPARGRDHPGMAALALHHDRPPVRDLHATGLVVPAAAEQAPAPERHHSRRFASDDAGPLHARAHPNDAAPLPASLRRRAAVKTDAAQRTREHCPDPRKH